MIDGVTGGDAARGEARRIALVGLVVNVALVVVLLTARGGPQWFVDFGSDEPVSPHARAVFGSDFDAQGPKGHDGQVFWAMARDPLLLDADRVAADLDRPAYRTQRMLYPALVAPWRIGGEQALLWGLIAVNLAAVALGTYAAARLAQHVGAPVRAALAFALNPLVLVAVAMDVADALALALVVGCVLGIARRQWAAATALAVLAVLAKESSFAIVVAVAALAPAVPRSRRISLVAVPALVGAAWALYARARLGWPPSQVQEFTAIPFKGFRDAIRFYYPDRSTVFDLVASFALIPVAAWTVVRWWHRRTLLMTAALPMALMVPFVAAPVVYLALNSVRAVGPALTFLVMDLYAAGMVDRSRARELPAPWRRVPLSS
jgi:hypothetical protein